MNQRDREILRKYLADRDVECPHCGYNLRGLPSPWCPECGMRLTLAAVAGFPEKIPVWQAMCDMQRWWLPLAVNIALIVIYYIIALGLGATGWFTTLVSMGGGGARSGLRLFHLMALMGSAVLGSIARIENTDPPLAGRLYTPAVKIVWALTAFHILGVVSTALVAMLSL